MESGKSRFMQPRKSGKALGVVVVLVAGTLGLAALLRNMRPMYPRDLKKIAVQLAATGTVTFNVAGADPRDPNYGAQGKPGTIAVNMVRTEAALIMPNHSAPRNWYSPFPNVVVIADQLM